MHRILFNRVPKKAREYGAAGAAIALVAILAIAGTWVFRRMDGAVGGSLWRLLLADRATLGFIRAAIVLIALYVIASAEHG